MYDEMKVSNGMNEIWEWIKSIRRIHAKYFHFYPCYILASKCLANCFQHFWFSNLIHSFKSLISHQIVRFSTLVRTDVIKPAHLFVISILKGTQQWRG